MAKYVTDPSYVLGLYNRLKRFSDNIKAAYEKKSAMASTINHITEEYLDKKRAHSL
ncbi:protein of unknown function [Xenorhabdus poinarii G6]|uniref:Uncharacterized protein n=1 Tax=Xenorhabdus poinarii G6 TaxID=1354304 RepID=A0A068R1F8_9GAMM|nr:protein of unknown function [Xenorhabdus poinarii G6]